MCPGSRAVQDRLAFLLMGKMLRFVFGVAAVGTVTSTVYCGMVVVAAARFGLRKRREARVPSDFFPPVSMLKPLHGTEPGMERNLETFFEQDYPEFELLFCARHASDEGLELARRVGERYPGVKARYETCGEPMPRFHNAKVYSLAKLDAVAAYDEYVTSDADVRVIFFYFFGLVLYLLDPDVGLCVGRASRTSAGSVNWYSFMPTTLCSDGDWPSRGRRCVCRPM